MNISIEALLGILIGFISVLVTIGAGYATLRERIKATEIHITNVKNDIHEMKQLFYQVMNALNVRPRKNDDNTTSITPP